MKTATSPVIAEIRRFLYKTLDIMKLFSKNELTFLGKNLIITVVFRLNSPSLVTT